MIALARMAGFVLSAPEDDVGPEKRGIIGSRLKADLALLGF